MFTTQKSKATLHLAGPHLASDIARNLTKRGVKGFHIASGWGWWEGEYEPAFQVTIIGDTAAPAHLAENPHRTTADPVRDVLMPADPEAFTSFIRTLAENLALDYKQQTVLWDIVPCVSEFTTPQAGYRRNG
jgi:hypothetical protein